MDLLRLTLEKQGEEGIMKRQSIRWVLRKTRGPDFQEGSRGILLESSLQTDLYFPACGQLEKLKVALIFIIPIHCNLW